MAQVDGLNLRIQADAAGAILEIDTTSASFKRLSESAKESVERINSELRKMSTGARDSAKQAGTEITRELASSLDGVGQKLEAGFGRIFKGIVAGVAAVTAGITAITKSSLDVGGGFEAEMTRVKVISGSTAKDLEMLTKKARELGESLPITAQQAAEAMTVMAQRGTQAADIMASVADVTALSISQSMNMADAAELMGSAMTSFGISVKDSSKVTDIFNNAANKSALNMSKLHYSLQYVAPAASAVGYSLESTVAALEVLANAGLSGEMMGTGLAMTLQKLASESEVLGVKVKNLDGSMRPLRDIFMDLQARGLTLAEATEVFDARAAKSALNLVKYAHTLQQNEAGLKQWGATQKNVNEQMGTYENRVKAFQSALEGVRLEIFEQIKGDAKDAAGGLTEITRATREWIEETQIASKTIQSFASGLGFKIPSGESFKQVLNDIDIGAFTEQVKSWGETARGIGESFANLYDSLKAPLGFIIENLDTFATISFWGWVTGKALQVPKTLIDIGGAFSGLGAAIPSLSGLSKLGQIMTAQISSWNVFKIAVQALTGEILTLSGLNFGAIATGLKSILIAAGPFAVVGAAIGGALYVVNDYIKSSKEVEKANADMIAADEKLSQAQLYVAVLANVKTGFEDLSKMAGGLNKELTEALNVKVNEKQTAFLQPILDAVQKYNESLNEASQDMKLSEEDVRAWSTVLVEAMTGGAKALSVLDPRLKQIVEAWIESGEAAKRSGEQTKLSVDEMMGSVEKQLSRTKEFIASQQEGLVMKFGVDISQGMSDLVAGVPGQIEEINKLLQGKNMDLAVGFAFDANMKQIEDEIAKISNGLNVSGDIVKVGVFNQLEKLGNAGDAFAKSLAEGMDIATLKVDSFAGKAQDAMDYLGAKPAQFLPAMTQMLSQMQKVNGITGNINESFKKAYSTLKKWTELQFNNLNDEISNLKLAVENGFLDGKVLQDRLKKSIPEFALKVNAELETTKGSLSKAEYSGVFTDKLITSLKSAFGDRMSGQIFEEIKGIIKQNGDISRYIERLVKSQDGGRTGQASLPVQQQNQQDAQAEQPGLNSAINELTDVLRQQSTQQSPQNTAPQNLTSTLSPLVGVIQTLISSLSGSQAVMTENTSAISRLSETMASKGNINEFNVQVNQTGFTVSSKEDARNMGRLAGEGMRAGIGNAMG